ASFLHGEIQGPGRPDLPRGCGAVTGEVVYRRLAGRGWDSGVLRSLCVCDLAHAGGPLRHWTVYVFDDGDSAGKLESTAGVFDGVGDCGPGAFPDGPAGVL